MQKGIHVKNVLYIQHVPCLDSSLYPLPLCFGACQHSVGMRTVPVNQMWAHRNQMAGRNSNCVYMLDLQNVCLDDVFDYSCR